ncbi:MAG: tetratricopeptide repeat protein [Candidatus Hermodarchaeota archaeon]
MVTELLWQAAPPHITLETLFQPADRFCFLVGSGISLDPPSCLPTGTQFTQALLERLIPERVLGNILALMRHEREEMQGPGDYLRFEHLMEYLEKFDPQLQTLDPYAACETPNSNHLFLAHMLTQGHPILTTNFDNLIEYALLNIGVARKLIYPVIHPQDWANDPKQNQFPVYKLHGSLIDVRSKQKSKLSIKRTLAQIARNKGGMFQFSPWKRNILQGILQDYDLIVVGYSGLNDFDVMPTLWGIPSPKRVLWISHDPTISANQAQIEVLQNRDSSVSLPTSYVDPVHHNLLFFAQYHVRQPYQLIHITVHTRKLLDWLWSQYLSHSLEPLDFSPCKEAEAFIPEQLAISETEQWLLTGEIFADRHIGRQGLYAYETALKIAKNTENQKLQGECLNAAGWLLYTQDRFEDALKCYQEALEIVEQLKNPRGKATLLKTIGWILQKQGRNEEALVYYEDALKIIQRLKNPYERATVLNTIGWLHYDQKNLDEALDHYQQALTIYERQEDVRGRATTLSNIADLFYAQQRLKEALEYYQQSLDIIEQQGDLQGKIIQLNKIGRFFENQGRPDRALTYYKQVFELADQLADLRGKATALSKIGRLFHNQGQIDQAMEYSQQALAIAKQLNNPDLIKEIEENFTAMEK